MFVKKNNIKLSQYPKEKTIVNNIYFMLSCIMSKKYTGEKARYRKDRHTERQKHIRAIRDNEAAEELPEILLPDIFSGIQEIYWKSLKSVPDPRSPGRRVYPLHLILHRVISGFIDGNKYIGVLFPTKRINTETGKKKLGALPTRKAVYTLLRRIDWTKADEVLAPLWECLGYTPDLIVRRKFRNPGEILHEFREEQKQAEAERRRRLHEEYKLRDRSEGMSAAKAKRSGYGKSAEVVLPKKAERVGHRKLSDRILTRYDLVIDGKAVKASYNAGVKERIVHVTEIRKDSEDNRSRFIIGAYPTETDRNGEWGAAVSISETLTPLSGDRVIVVSGDAGFCIEEFCEWLNAKGFFLPLPDKEKLR